MSSSSKAGIDCSSEYTAFSQPEETSNINAAELEPAAETNVLVRFPSLRERGATFLLSSSSLQQVYRILT